MIKINENEEILVKNISEELVAVLLDDCIEKSGTCSCPRCKADISAYALNHLTPHYVVSTVGSAYVRLNAASTQAQADIISAIMTAILVVSQNPRH